MMKKILSLLLALVTAFTLTGCGISEEELDKKVLSVVASEVSEIMEERLSEAEETAPPKTTAPTTTTTITSQSTTSATEESKPTIDKKGSYTTKDDVALYIYTYGCLPDNFMTKKEAQALGWEGGSLEPYAEGMCIGGSRFGNYEGLLPEKDGRTYTECDIDTLGAEKRGAKRIVFSNDGLIYYTDDHYESFELLYGEEEQE